MLQPYIKRFWDWYERHEKINTAFVTVLFVWQLWHLYWLTTAVVTVRLFGVSFYNPGPLIELLIISADFAEIPALIAATILYVNQLRKGFSWKSLSFIVLINSQWLHILWITDEFIVRQFSDDLTVGFPIWLAWLAIFIDYLELPVIFDTIRMSIKNLREYLAKKRQSRAIT